jgi:hypothetical protein
MFDVSRPALSTEYRNQNRIREAAPVLRLRQAAKRISASEVFEDRRFAHHSVPRLASTRRQKKYEIPQSKPVPAAQPHASGPSPTDK